MKIQGRFPIVAEEHEIFAPDVAEKMIGQITDDGWTIVAASNDGQSMIWLIVEKNFDIPGFPS